ncbi:BatA domain-containing protein [bacterium]|nr:BatA domain-containing protein [bacterium]
MFKFEHPYFLFSLFSIVILIILHLIRKKKIKIVYFSTIYFLKKSHKKISRKLKIKQFLLFLFRLIILTALIFLISKTFWIKTGDVITNIADKSSYIVLDNRYTMLRKNSDTTDFEIAKEKIIKFFQNNPNKNYFFYKDELHLITSKEQLESFLDKTDIQYPPYLGNYFNFTKNISKYPKMDGVFVTNIVSETPPENIKLHLIAHKETKNAYLMNLYIKQIDSQIYQVETDVNSEGNSFDTTISLIKDNKKVANKILNLTPNQKQRVTFRFKGDSGKYELQLGDDDLLEDNRMLFSLEKNSLLKIVIINGGMNPIPYLDESFYLMNAIDSSPFRHYWSVTVKNEIEKDIYNSYDLFIFIDSSFPTIYQKELENIISMKKPIFISVGNSTDIEQFNQFWSPYIQWRNLKDENSKNSFKYISMISSEHPIVQKIPFIKSELIEYPIFKYLNFTTEQNITPIISMNDGTPLFVEKIVNGSKWLIFSSTLSRAWGDFPLSTHFAPLIQESILYLLSDKLKKREPYFYTYGEIHKLFPDKILKPDWYKLPNNKNGAYNTQYLFSQFLGKDRKIENSTENTQFLEGEERVYLKNWLILLLFLVLFLEHVVDLKRYFRN